MPCSFISALVMTNEILKLLSLGCSCWNVSNLKKASSDIVPQYSKIFTEKLKEINDFSLMIEYFPSVDPFQARRLNRVGLHTTASAFPGLISHHRFCVGGFVIIGAAEPPGLLPVYHPLFFPLNSLPPAWACWKTNRRSLACVTRWWWTGLFPHECRARMDSRGTVEVGGPAGCLHEDFNGDLTNASGQAQHSLAQRGHVGTVSTCYGVTHCIWTLGWPLIFTSISDVHISFLLHLRAVCQDWGNAWCSNNASVLGSGKWWKRPVITGIIKTVRGSSVDTCLPSASLTASQAAGSPPPQAGLLTPKINAAVAA